MSVLVPSNELLRNRASWCRLLLMGCQVRLFRQAASIDPATLVASFVECNFPGYAPIEIVNATLNGVNKVLDGQYEFSSIPLIWTPTADDNQLAYGLYISGGGMTWSFSTNFASAKPVRNGVDIRSTLRFDNSMIVAP